MNEEYREAVAIANKFWAFFVGFSWDNRDADELVHDAEVLRRFIEHKCFEFITSDAVKSSSLIPKKG